MAPRDRNSSKRSASSEADYTRADLEREFPDDATCLEFLWRQNFSEDGEHARCPKCGVERKFHRVASRASYSCDTCGHHIHPTAGTVFHKSSTGLHLWFKAIFLMSSTRCGVSAKQIERELGVTYKTAWRIANLIRNKLMAQSDEPLDGEVEADETSVGGRAFNRRYPKRTREQHLDRRTDVWGAVERGGRVRASVVPSRSGPTVRAEVRKFVLPSTVLFTDDYVAYVPLGQEGYRHRRINHSERVYVHGNVHTQTIEGFWGLLKNGLRGTYHAVSRKWLQGYLNEFAWRYNERRTDEPMFLTLIAEACRASS